MARARSVVTSPCVSLPHAIYLPFTLPVYTYATVHLFFFLSQYTCPSVSPFALFYRSPPRPRTHEARCLSSSFRNRHSLIARPSSLHTNTRHDERTPPSSRTPLLYQQDSSHGSLFILHLPPLPIHTHTTQDHDENTKTDALYVQHSQDKHTLRLMCMLHVPLMVWLAPYSEAADIGCVRED